VPPRDTHPNLIQHSAISAVFKTPASHGFQATASSPLGSPWERLPPGSLPYLNRPIINCAVRRLHSSRRWLLVLAQGRKCTQIP
jgi:hypothetical protein